MVDIYSFNNNTTSTTETFKFTFSACPSFKFSFDRPDIPVTTQQQPFKRRRALSDVDGDSNEGRKKRRLRLQLITSRLSRPFSQPASNIVVRGTSKVVLWGAGKRRPGVLRKAAIMNLIRKKMDAAKDFMRLQYERSHAAIKLKEISSHKQPRTASFLLPPSPLGLSNYDALDIEDNAMVDDDDGDSEIYSDFNVMNPNTADSDDFEYLDALDGLSSEVLPDTPPLTPSEEGIVEMLKEQETDGGSFFVEMRD